MPTLEELQKSHFQLLVVIVNRKDGEKATHALQERHCRFQISCLAHGTSGSELMDMLGFGTVDKAVIVCLIPSFRNPDLMAELTAELKLSKAGKGIAFTVPISGISVPIIRFIETISHDNTAYAPHGDARSHGHDSHDGHFGHDGGGRGGEQMGRNAEGGAGGTGSTGGTAGEHAGSAGGAGANGAGDSDHASGSGNAGGIGADSAGGAWDRRGAGGGFAGGRGDFFGGRLGERFAQRAEMVGKWHSAMENEVNKMSGNTSHDVIIAVVNKGNSQELVEVAKSAGARGGTVLNGRRTGMGGAANIFGMSVQAEKEIVAIIVSREIKHGVMKAINESFGFHNEAHGIVFSMPVDSVAGIEQ